MLPRFEQFEYRVEKLTSAQDKRLPAVVRSRVAKPRHV